MVYRSLGIQWERFQSILDTEYIEVGWEMRRGYENGLKTTSETIAEE